jgi:hypothetical protein
VNMIAPGAIERRIEDTIAKALNRQDASEDLERIGAAPINDVSSFRHTPFRDHGHGCIILLESGEQYAVTIRRMEEQ